MTFEDLLDATAFELGLGSLAAAETGVAALRIDDSLTVLLEKSPFNPELVVVYASLGTVPESGRVEFYEALMEAQLFGSEVGAGCSFGLASETGELFLNRCYPLTAAAAVEFVEALDQFVNWATHWKARLASGLAREVAPDEVSGVSGVSLGNFVRI